MQASIVHAGLSTLVVNAHTHAREMSIGEICGGASFWFGDKSSHPGGFYSTDRSRVLSKSVNCYYSIGM
jgi:hypothetical protein